MSEINQSSTTARPWVMTDEYLRRSIRAIGLLQYVISFLFLGGSIVPFVMLLPAREFSMRYVSILILVATAVFFFMVARSLRKFRPWARTATMVISGIGLLAFPLGTAIYGPFLYVLVKGKHLFSQDLQSVPGRPIGLLKAGPFG